MQSGYTSNGLNRACQIGNIKVLNCTVNATNPQDGDTIAITPILPTEAVMLTINNIAEHTTGYAILYIDGTIKGWNMSNAMTMNCIYR